MEKRDVFAVDEHVSQIAPWGAKRRGEGPSFSLFSSFTVRLASEIDVWKSVSGFRPETLVGAPLHDAPDDDQHGSQRKHRVTLSRSSARRREARRAEAREGETRERERRVTTYSDGEVADGAMYEIKIGHYHDHRA